MKKWFAMALVACVATAVQAAPAGSEKGGGSGKGHGKKEMSKEQFFAQQKRMAEKKGREYNQAAAEKRFAKMDTNKDGKLSAEEKSKARSKHKGKNKGGGQANAAE